MLEAVREASMRLERAYQFVACDERGARGHCSDAPQPFTPCEMVRHQDDDNCGDQMGPNATLTPVGRESGPYCVAPRATHARALRGACWHAVDQKGVDLRAAAAVRGASGGGGSTTRGLPVSGTRSAAGKPNISSATSPRLYRGERSWRVGAGPGTVWSDPKCAADVVE